MNYNLISFEAAAGLKNQLVKSDLPEIVFSGRSNVGKSTLINKTVNRKSLARTSSQPGKTATVNFYKMPDFRLVDLPGYGYAKVSGSEKLRWSTLVGAYFESGRNIALVVQIIDMRHEPSSDDCDMIDYLVESKLPFIVVCTKCDKLNKTKEKEMTDYYNELFSSNGYFWMPVSGEKGTNVDKLREIIEKQISK